MLVFGSNEDLIYKWLLNVDSGFFPPYFVMFERFGAIHTLFLENISNIKYLPASSSLVLKMIWSMMNHIEVSFVGGHLVDLWVISKPKLILVDDEVVKNIYFNIFSIVNWMKLGSKIITFCNRGWPLLGYQCNLSRKGNEFVLCVPCLILNCATPWFLWVAEVICQMCRHLCKNKSFWTYMLITNQSASIRAKQRKDYEENAFQWSSWVLLMASDIPKTH